MLFENKTIVVTGSAKGIGKEIALQFGKEKANVVVSDLSKEDCIKTVKEILSFGGKAISVKCDVSDKIQVKALIGSAVKEFNSIDVLVNNAGIYPFASFQEMTEKQWDKVIDINLKGTFLCSREAAKQMIKQGKGGKIINISSVAGILGFCSLAHYCASKGGVNAFTRALALELAQFKINVNAVGPGPIKTPGIGNLDEKILKGIIDSVPWGRIGEPADIANAILFLASDKADFITGQVLEVDGGMTIK
ncbi:MAG: hypothetical protein COT90_02670 [Candidatus Diapherotrites archaeon CG10_big_fil_rev_8_21_14_0_10_31_34]|nr:MAG: hypothetical protein COT90_02670 [Candidatus Diapherotrites archaeon CG10_big_fil_rev_8_21_14_0_10_31_34]PJA17424.1 MAG: hypothetical protein COX63_02775 [Candidatus Diapherotrites archaeon CG_4_10_14_0_2_um_filter_31_5]